MELSIRVFIVAYDDKIKRLPLARYERFLNRDPDERLLEYAGQRVRYALIVVDLVNRKFLWNQGRYSTIAKIRRTLF